MEKLQTILDLFAYVHKNNMCTNPYCTTCGAMEYRNMCKGLGLAKIRELIEATTEKDFLYFKEANPFTPWVEPFKTLLLDGFCADPKSTMMAIYDDGSGLWRYGRAKELLLEINGVKVYAVSGNVFRSYGCEVIAIFNKHSLQAVSHEYQKLKADLYPSKEGVFFTKDSMPDNCCAFYLKNTYGSIMDESKELFKEVETILSNLLVSLSLKGYKSVSMNGLRTSGYSEFDNLRIIINWIHNNPKTSLKEIVLVDKDGGFNQLKNNVEFKMTATIKKSVK